MFLIQSDTCWAYTHAYTCWGNESIVPKVKTNKNVTSPKTFIMTIKNKLASILCKLSKDCFISDTYAFSFNVIVIPVSKVPNAKNISNCRPRPAAYIKQNL